MTTNDELPREASEGPIFHPDWGTHAFEHYNGNIRSLDALLAMVFSTAFDTERSANLLKARRQSVEDNHSGPWAINLSYSMNSWQVAMRVTAVEVYLQDALTFLAAYDPEFIRTRGSKQTWEYEDVRSASDDDNSLWTFCSNWARSFVGDGGPSRWARALEKSGLGKFTPDDVNVLEQMWGFRHMRVHHGRGFSKEFIKRHRDVAERIRRDGLQLSDLETWAGAANRLVRGAEAGIAGRLRGVLGEELIAARLNAESERQMARWKERYETITSTSTEEERDAHLAKRMEQLEAQAAIRHELFGDGSVLGDAAEWSGAV